MKKIIFIFLLIILNFVESKNLNDIFKEIASEDREKLEWLFYSLINEDNFGYTLFGEKPVSKGNWHSKRLPFEIIFANKKTNSCGLQIADLVAHPIGRYVINTEQESRSFKILEKKILGRNGKKDGYGLKVFPKYQ